MRRRWTVITPDRCHVWMARMKHNLAGDTIDPNSLLHVRVVLFGRHAAGQRTLVVRHFHKVHVHELLIATRWHDRETNRTSIRCLLLRHNLVQARSCVFLHWCVQTNWSGLERDLRGCLERREHLRLQPTSKSKSIFTSRMCEILPRASEA